MKAVTWLADLLEERDRRAAREAIVRCYGVPYMSELDERELRGMVLLERSDEVTRDDEGFSAVHWHRNPAGR